MEKNGEQVRPLGVDEHRRHGTDSSIYSDFVNLVSFWKRRRPRDVLRTEVEPRKLGTPTVA